MNGNPGVWFEIYVQDMARAKAFYEAVFETTLEKLSLDQPEMWAFPSAADQPGCGGALVYMEGVPSGGMGTVTYFGCADCAEEGARVTAAGGSIMKGKFSIGDYGFIVLAHDTEGNLFGLHSMQ